MTGFRRVVQRFPKHADRSITSFIGESLPAAANPWPHSRGDLHVHSTRSVGVFFTVETGELAKANGLDFLVMTEGEQIPQKKATVKPNSGYVRRERFLEYQGQHYQNAPKFRRDDPGFIYDWDVGSSIRWWLCPRCKYSSCYRHMCLTHMDW